MDLQRYGYTKGCEGCKAILRKGPHQSHNEECRKNVEAKMKEAEPEKYGKQQEAYTKKVAQQVSISDQNKTPRIM